MKGRRRPPNDSIDKLELNEIVAQSTSGAWLEKVLREEAADLRDNDLRDLALSVADPSVSVISQVFELHGLVDGVFASEDNSRLYRVIAEIAERLIRKRLIDLLGNSRRDPGGGKDRCLSGSPRGERTKKRRMGPPPSYLRLVFSADGPGGNTASVSLLNDVAAGGSDLDPDEDGLAGDLGDDPYPYVEHTGVGLRERLRAVLEPDNEPA